MLAIDLDVGGRIQMLPVADSGSFVSSVTNRNRRTWLLCGGK